LEFPAQLEIDIFDTKITYQVFVEVEVTFFGRLGFKFWAYFGRKTEVIILAAIFCKVQASKGSTQQTCGTFFKGMCTCKCAIIIYIDCVYEELTLLTINHGQGG
jgi:hypothetical protein